VPRWDLAPYVALWQITGGWAISGDLPTDYVLDETIPGPRVQAETGLAVAPVTAPTPTLQTGAGVDPGRPVKARGDGPSDVPLYAMVERAIRVSDGGLAVTAARNTLRFHRRRGAL